MIRRLVPFGVMVLLSIFYTVMQVQVYPEFFVYPHFVKQGLVPYRDFFDHHGFLTHYLIAPISGNYSTIQFLYVFLEIIQLITFFLLIKKKVENEYITGLFVFLFGFFRFSVAQHIIWFDTWISFFLLLAYFAFDTRRETIAWICIICAVLIKPTAILFIIPFFFKAKHKKQAILIIIVSFIFVSLFFFLQHGLKAMYNQLIRFNAYYIQTTYKTFYLGVGLKYVLVLMFSLIVGIYYYSKSKEKSPFLLILMLISVTFFLQGLAKQNLTIFSTFFILFLVQIFIRSHKKVFFLFFLCSFGLFLLRDVYKVVGQVYNRKLYLRSELLKEMKDIQKSLTLTENQTVAVLANRPEIYSYLSIKPPVTYVLLYPWIYTYYPEAKVALSMYIRKYKPLYLFIPHTFLEYEQVYQPILSDVIRSYRIIKSTATYTIWLHQTI